MQFDSASGVLRGGSLMHADASGPSEGSVVSVRHIMLVEKWISNLRQLLNDQELFVHDVRVGVFYSGAQVSSGHAGVAFTPRGVNDTVCCPSTAASAPPAGRMLGRRAWELAEFALAESPLRRAIGVATLNALSALAFERYGVPGGKAQPGRDALQAAGIAADDRVAMVGAFAPFIKALKGKVATLRIIDSHPNALKPDERQFWVSREETAETLRHASVVIISGAALVEGGIDFILESSLLARRRVMAGPTAPLWAPPFFESGVNVLGGIQVRDPALLLTIASQGGSGYFFNDAADKISLVREDALN